MKMNTLLNYKHKQLACVMKILVFMTFYALNGCGGVPNGITYYKQLKDNCNHSLRFREEDILELYFDTREWFNITKCTYILRTNGDPNYRVSVNILRFQGKQLRTDKNICYPIFRLQYVNFCLKDRYHSGSTVILYPPRSYYVIVVDKDPRILEYVTGQLRFRIVKYIPPDVHEESTRSPREPNALGLEVICGIVFGSVAALIGLVYICVKCWNNNAHEETNSERMLRMINQTHPDLVHDFHSTNRAQSQPHTSPPVTSPDQIYKPDVPPPSYEECMELDQIQLVSLNDPPPPPVPTECVQNV